MSEPEVAERRELRDLPEGWHWADLGDIALARLGKTPRKKDYRDEGSHKIIKFRDVKDGGEIDWQRDDKGFVDSADEVTNSLKDLLPGDVLVTASAHMSEHIGKKVGLVTSVPPQYEKAYVVGEILQIRSGEGLLPKWVMYFLQSTDGYKAIQRRVHGVHLTGGRAQNIEIPIAPRDQQDCIVAEVEKQFSRLDEAVASLKRVKANLKRYKAAVLKAAVEGKLTEEWRKQNPDVEPASKLLERILAERRTKWEEAELAKMKAKGKEPKNDRWKEKYKIVGEVEPKELTNLPAGYLVVSLDTLCSKIGDVDHKMPKAQSKGYPYISTKDFLENGNINFADAKKISEEDYIHLCRKIFPEEGDVLLSRYGTVGEVRLVKTERKFQASYSVAIIKPVLGEISAYLAMILQTNPLQKQIKMHTRSTAQPDLGLGHIREFEVPFPSLSEQEKIMEEVDDRVSLINRLENEIELAIIKAQNTRQSILATAFCGCLANTGDVL